MWKLFNIQLFWTAFFNAWKDTRSKTFLAFTDMNTFLLRFKDHSQWNLDKQHFLTFWLCQITADVCTAGRNSEAQPDMNYVAAGLNQAIC